VAVKTKLQELLHAFQTSNHWPEVVAVKTGVPHGVPHGEHRITGQRLWPLRPADPTADSADSTSNHWLEVVALDKSYNFTWLVLGKQVPTQQRFVELCSRQALVSRRNSSFS
jgi:hypothetical protein